jgi:CHAD domain-containing protein
LFALALDLSGRGRDALALLPAVDSKAARGYRLAAGERPAPVKANARAVAGPPPRRHTPAAALRGVVERGTTLLLANTAPLVAADDPEFVHQARVAVRRLRSASRLLGDEAGWRGTLDADLRWIARRLGAVRDWDVLATQTMPALAAALPADAARLAGGIGGLRRQADARLRQTLGDARFARLALRLLRWAGTGADPRAGDSPTLADVAGRRLARLHRRLFEAAQFFVALPVERQHRVRIRAKRLRYALDLFADALPAKPTARYVGQLALLQDELGAINDAVVAAALVRRLARAARADAAAADEWLQQRRQQHALRAEAALAELAQLPRPWRRKPDC